MAMDGEMLRAGSLCPRGGWLLCCALAALLIPGNSAANPVREPPRRMQAAADLPPVDDELIVESNPQRLDMAPLEVAPPDMLVDPAAPFDGLGGEQPVPDGFQWLPGEWIESRAWSSSPGSSPQDWTWQVLPDGLIYKTYLAGVKEPRLSTTFLYQSGYGWVMDSMLGARVGVLRHGHVSDTRIEGWQWDVEGAGQPRLDLEEQFDLDAADFRAGTYLTHRRDKWAWRFGYYHISSHAGDEFMIRNPDFVRRNYVRDSILFGTSFYPVDALRLYGEAAYAFHTDGGAEPWELQFGVDFSPVCSNGFRPKPFFAINGQLRQDFNFGGNLVVQAGGQWRSVPTGRLLRLGMEYYNGKTRQWEFFDVNEQQWGMGIWYDF
jgi:hypothetical protein